MRAPFQATRFTLAAPAFAGLLALGACTQDENASTAQRDTHMGAAGQEAPQPPPLPAAVNPPPAVTAPAPSAPASPAVPAAADAGGDAMAAKAGDAGAADAAPAKPHKH